MDQATYEKFRDSWWPYVIAIIIGTITFIRNYVGGNQCPCKDNIINKVVLITGASGGLGLQTAKELAQRGGKIILTCRNLEKGNEAVKFIKNSVQYANIDVRELDLSSLSNIRNFVQNLQNYETIDILINNAGIMFHPYEITTEGFEKHFVTNYLGHFLLTHLLLPKLKQSQNGRIINIVSQAYSSSQIILDDLNSENSNQRNVQTFTQSKLALVLMTRYMGKLLKGTNVTINCVDPGLMKHTHHMDYSPLKSSLPVKLSVWPWMWLFLKTPKQGCQTVLYLAVDPSLTNTTGKYFKNCEIEKLKENCMDESIDKELYNKSCSLVQIKSRIKSFDN